MKILECSSRGDKRFSSFYAYVDFLGEYDSIEHHYQNCKRDYNGNKVGKGVKVHHIIINNKQLSSSYLSAFYKLLWIKYLDKHQELVTYAKQYDDSNDMFKGPHTMNCQADVIRSYVKEGRESLLTSDLADLITKL